MRRVGSLGLRAVGMVVGVAAIAAGAAVPARAQFLTDLVLNRYTTGNVFIAEGWNTRGADGVSNLYLRDTGGTFLNSGNAAAVQPNIDLSAPGVYTFNYAGDIVGGQSGATVFGLNLFFNGNAATPAISARVTEGGGFVANGLTSALPNFGTVAGANTLSFSANNVIVTLTGLTVQSTTSTTNLVQSFDNTSGGILDTVGTIQITVTPAVTAAPEPGSVALLGLVGMALTGTAFARRRRASRA